MRDLNSLTFDRLGINCPAPLPEYPADAQLTGLLVPAPYVVPEKKAKKKDTGTRKEFPVPGGVGLIARRP